MEPITDLLAKQFEFLRVKIYKRCTVTKSRARAISIVGLRHV